MDAASLWSNSEREYNDYQCTLNKKQFVYDKPNKLRCRDHLIRKRALFFIKTKKGWRFIGHVTRVDELGTDKVCLTVDQWGPKRYYPSKNAILEAMGFEPVMRAAA